MGAMGALAAFGPAAARAAVQASDESSVCLSMIYGKAARFESDRFRDKHLPLLRQIYGDCLERIEMRHAPKPGKDVPPAPIVAAVNLWIRDLQAFGAITLKSGPEVVADLAKVTTDSPWVQYDQAISVLGDGRDAVQVGTDCLSFYYPNGEKVRWDPKQYAEGYVPALAEAYGKEALSRIEVCNGKVAQGGGVPRFAGAMTLYVRYMPAFTRMSRAAGMKLLPEAFKATDIRPVPATLIVRAVG
jgi:hypothetical protein